MASSNNLWRSCHAVRSHETRTQARQLESGWVPCFLPHLLLPLACLPSALFPPEKYIKRIVSLHRSDLLSPITGVVTRSVISILRRSKANTESVGACWPRYPLLPGWSTRNGESSQITTIKPEEESHRHRGILFLVLLLLVVSSIFVAAGTTCLEMDRSLSGLIETDLSGYDPIKCGLKLSLYGSLETQASQLGTITKKGKMIHFIQIHRTKALKLP